MRILSMRALFGPNVYHYKPVLVTRLDLEDLAGKENTSHPYFAGRLVELLPGLRDHHCAKGEPGGFIERLSEGTYFGHVVEHVALELMSLAGAEAFYGKTMNAGRAGLYDIVTRFDCEQTARHALRCALEIVQALIDGEIPSIEQWIAQCREIASANRLGPSAAAIVKALERRRIPYERLNDGSLFRLGYGACSKMVQATMASTTRAIAVDIACDKELTKKILRQAMIPVPQGRLVTRLEDAKQVLAEIGRVVIKPLDGNQGRGVSLDVLDDAGLSAAFERARQISDRVIVEEQFKGHDYRLLVVGGAVVAASLRIPASVTGDGEHSIARLVAIENSNPQRGQGHAKPLTRLSLDESALACLSAQGFSSHAVPPRGARVALAQTANLSTGGEAMDVTARVHPTIIELCTRAARLIGLDICGVDLITPDIASPLPPAAAGIVELNAAPGIRMHEHPSQGEPRDAGEAIVEMLYPPGTSSRIPIIAITGTNGKTTTTRMIERVVAGAGCVTGMTTTDGIFIGGRLIVPGDTTGFTSCQTVLADPAVEVAVLEVARGGLIRRGLAFDEADVAVITNIQPDHIGQDGIESLDDLVRIKSLVAECVREGGSVILNADDPILAELPAHRRMISRKRKIVYFSLNADSEVIRRHVASMGTAYYVRGGWVVEARGGQERQLMRESSLPAAMRGAARFQVANAMAAIAACRAYGLEPRAIARQLSIFESDVHNPGRLNLFRIGDGYVLVDYGHNPAAISAIASLAAQWRGERRVGCVLTLPGDRCESLAEEAGRVAARGFDRVIIREDNDLRGRPRGELAGRLFRAIRSERPSLECRVVLNAREAFTSAIESMAENELLVLFQDELSDAIEVLNRYGAVPVPVIAPLESVESAWRETVNA